MLFKIISIVGSLTCYCRIIWLYEEIYLLQRVIGAGMVSDCFFVFKLPNLFRRIFGEGAMNAAFIPVVSGVKTNSGKKINQIISLNIFSILLVFLFIFIILVEIFIFIVDL